MHPREMNLHIHPRHMGTRMVLAALFMITSNWKIPNVHQIYNWVNELKYIHIMDYIHSNKKWSSAALDMNLTS